jgi:type VII secretion integral membrane protein EccD
MNDDLTMTTRFTRLSVVADGRQLDASLPASRPIVEFLADLVGLLSLPLASSSAGYVLSSPSRGPMPGGRTLDDLGVLDGEVLFLTVEEAAAESPMIDDVLGAIATVADRRAAPWAGAARDAVTTCLLAALGVVSAGVLALLSDQVLSGGLSAILAVALDIAAFALRRRFGLVLAWSALPVAGAAGWQSAQAASADVRLAAGAGALAVASAVAGLVSHRSIAVVTAGVTTALAAVGIGVGRGLGADRTALAAWSALALVLGLALLPGLALSTSGLVGLVRQAEAGDPVARAVVERRVAWGQAMVNGLTFAIGTVAALTAGVLVVAGRPFQAALGLLIGLVFLLRSRGFTPAGQVGFILLAPISAAVALAIALPRWTQVSDADGRLGWAAAGSLLVVGLVAVGGYVRLGEIAGARLSRLYDRVDPIAILLVVPAVLLAQNVFSSLVSSL